MKPGYETLEEWEEWEIENIRRFVGWMKLHNQEDPENYPLELPDGEWDDQYREWT